MSSLSRNIILAIIVLTVVMISTSYCRPGKDHAKIRIHVPVKHHTHVHTKTIIKKVPVPIPVPVKEEKHHHHVHEHEHHEHHGHIDHHSRNYRGVDDEDDYEYIPKFKKRKYHPFV